MVSVRSLAATGALLVAVSIASSQPPQPPGTPFRPEPENKQSLASDVKTGDARAAVTPDMKGDIHMARKEYREAIDDYMTMPDSAVKFNKIGISYHQMLDLGKARGYYQRSIKMNPKYAEAVNNLGTVYYATKNYRRAVSQYKRALALAPASASIYSNLGTAYFARKQYARASEAYQKALELDSEVFEHRSTAGVLLQERTVEERAKFHYYLAKTYAKAGQNERAMLYIRKALEEGFKERKKFVEDPEFVALKDLPEFKELMALEPRVL
jgi:tetratricopeptide (TPR) repeat protein